MNKGFCVTALFMLLVSISAIADSAAETITPFKAEYTAYKWGDALGTASMELESLANGRYSLLYQSHVSKFFLSDKRAEHSIFSFDNGQFTPMEYHYSRSGTGRDKALHVEFLDETDKIKIDKNGKRSEIVWNNESDNQLYRLMIPGYLQQGEKDFAVNFINYRGEKKQYTMRVEGQENVSLPYGDMNAIKVKIIRQNSSRETYAWFSPTLSYQLVRLQQFKDGEEQGDIRLSAYTSQ